jgi:predicted transcriptional regulator
MAVKRSGKESSPQSEAELRQRIDAYVAMSRDLDGVDVRTYLYMSGKLNFDEPVHVPQIEMSVMLRRRQTHISRALKNLVTAGVLIVGPEGTRGSKWMLNRECGT